MPRGFWSLDPAGRSLRHNVSYFTVITGAFDACPEMVNTTFSLPVGTPAGTAKLA